MASREDLVTGAAGFIDAHLAKKRLKTTDDTAVALDDVNNYYDPGVKEARLHMLSEADGEGCFTFVRGDLCDGALVERQLAGSEFDVVTNLAEREGVRYSIENPKAYIDSNLVGLFNNLEGCRTTRWSTWCMRARTRSTCLVGFFCRK